MRARVYTCTTTLSSGKLVFVRHSHISSVKEEPTYAPRLVVRYRKLTDSALFKSIPAKELCASWPLPSWLVYYSRNTYNQIIIHSTFYHDS